MIKYNLQSDQLFVSSGSIPPQWRNYKFINLKNGILRGSFGSGQKIILLIVTSINLNTVFFMNYQNWDGQCWIEMMGVGDYV